MTSHVITGTLGELRAIRARRVTLAPAAALLFTPEPVNEIPEVAEGTY